MAKENDNEKTSSTNTMEDNEKDDNQESEEQAEGKEEQAEGKEEQGQEDKEKKTPEAKTSFTGSFSDPQESADESEQESTEQESSSEKTQEEDEDEDDEFLKKLLSDPDEVVNDIERRVYDRLEKKSEDQQRVKAAWDSFYENNPDLKSHPDLIEAVKNQVLLEDQNRKKKYSWEEGSKEVAMRARKILKSIKSDSYEEVDTSTASDGSAVSSSSQSMPSKEKKPETKGFIAQVKSFRKGRYA